MIVEGGTVYELVCNRVAGADGCVCAVPVSLFTPYLLERIGYAFIEDKETEKLEE